MLRMASLFDRKLAGPLSEGSATGGQLTYSLLKETRSRFVKSSSKDNFSVNNHWTFNFSGTYWRAKKIMNFHSWFWSSRWEWASREMVKIENFIWWVGGCSLYSYCAPFHDHHNHRCGRIQKVMCQKINRVGQEAALEEFPVSSSNSKVQVRCHNSKF